MKRLAVTDVLHGAWNAQTAWYVMAAMLCALSLHAQMTWRISGEWLVRWLPWLGTLLFLVSLLLLVSHVLASAGADQRADDDDGESELGGAARERPFGFVSVASSIGTALVWAYIALGAFVGINARFDFSTPEELSGRIEGISRHEIYLGEFLSYAWALVRPSAEGGRPLTLFLSAKERPHRWGGEPVRLKRHRGLFRVAWFSEITRDEEALNRAILARLPKAAQPWRQLMNFYVEREHWERAQDAARAYLEAYPAGYSDVLQIGNRLAVARDHHRSLVFYEAVFRAHRDYETYNLYGWGLSRVGRHDEAVELLRASIPLDQRQYWAFYHLGYVYLGMGKRAEALEMFRNVLERRPEFPEIQVQVAQLAR